MRDFRVVGRSLARPRSGGVYNGVVVVVVVVSCGNNGIDAYCFSVIIVLALPWWEEDLLSSFCTSVMTLWSFLSPTSAMLPCSRNRVRCGLERVGPRRKDPGYNG